MPELPEVETVCRGLAPEMIGATFDAIELRRANLRFPFGRDFKTRLVGAKVVTLRRRAKYLVAGLVTGDCLVMHLGMSGRFLVKASRAKSCDTLGEYIYDAGSNPKHDHVVFHMSGGSTITYNDPRRFGFMVLIRETMLDDHALFRHLGVEPLGNELSALYLSEKASERRTSLKSFLMDQRIVAGLGNIYVCEALHSARLSPNRAAGCLSAQSGTPTARAERLVIAIREVLQKAVALGGSTLRDYRDPSGASGGFQETFSVYGRAGEACLRKGCSGIVKRSIQQGRSTFYCGSCQR